MLQVIRVGLVGYGLSGSVFHTPFLNEGAGYVMVGIVSSRRALVSKNHPGVACLASLDELLALPNLDLVVIAAPNHLHFAYAKQCLAAGKHVVVEKPFVTAMQEGRELIALAKAKQKLLSVFHNRRFDGDFLTVKDLIERRTLGALSHVESHFDRFRPVVDQRWKELPQPGNGSFYDLGSHLLDQALVLFGKPNKILADIGTQRSGAVADDYFHVLMSYDRLRVVIHGGSLVAKAPPRFQLHGDLGSYVKYGFDPQEAMLKACVRPGDEGWGLEPASQHGVLTHVQNGVSEDQLVVTLRGRYEEFYRRLYRAIRFGEEPPVAAEEALAVIELIEQCRSPY